MTHEDKLQELRKLWANASRIDRKLLEQRARLLRWAIEKRDTDKTVQNVRSAIMQ